MSTFKVEVVQIGKIETHPKADALELTQVFGYPLVIRKGEFKEGDKAVYVPIDSIVPTNRPEFSFLGERSRISALKLRGIFSQGLLVAARQDWEVGLDVTDYFGITKYNPPEPTGDNTSPPDALVPNYTDIEHIRRYGREVFSEGEEVIASEKIHGMNARYTLIDGKFHAGSNNAWKKDSPSSPWWRAARKYNLPTKLSPGFVLYGEVYGYVMDLHYGVEEGGVDFRAFDIFDTTLNVYLDHDDFVQKCQDLDIPIVPVLYRGPYDPDALSLLGENPSLLGGGISEGVVIKAVRERFHPSVSRAVLKLHSQQFLLRQEKSVQKESGLGH